MTGDDTPTLVAVACGGDGARLDLVADLRAMLLVDVHEDGTTSLRWAS